MTQERLQEALYGKHWGLRMTRLTRLVGEDYLRHSNQRLLRRITYLKPHLSCKPIQQHCRGHSTSTRAHELETSNFVISSMVVQTDSQCGDVQLVHSNCQQPCMPWDHFEFASLISQNRKPVQPRIAEEDYPAISSLGEDSHF
jgi:hypothetical protein